MKRIILLEMCLILLLVYGNTVKNARAQEAIVYIDPESSSAPEIGSILTINISIRNVTHLYGYHFILWYNTSLLDGVEIELPPNHFLTPSQPGNIFDMFEIDDNYNSTHGVLGAVVTLLGAEFPKNGSGVLATITFNATATDGPSPLKLNNPGSPYPVQLSDPNANFIPCAVIDGTIEVLPEYPTLLIIILMLVIASIIILSKKSVCLHMR